jgi:hypothetical protein
VKWHLPTIASDATRAVSALAAMPLQAATCAVRINMRDDADANIADNCVVVVAAGIGILLSKL